MPAQRRSAVPSRLNVERLEERELPAHYLATPVVPVLDDTSISRLGEVFRRGQTLGNRPNVFARAGDSITFAPEFLVPLGTAGAVDRAGDQAFASTLAYFRSGRVGGADSFTRPSTAAYPGWTSSDVLARLPDELSASRPSFVLVMVGTNDLTLGVTTETYRSNLAAIARTALNAGVIPVLSTLPDNRLQAAAQARQPEFNQTIQTVAEELGVPVLNYWRALQRLPNTGISTDGIHPNAAPADAADFSPTGLAFGYNVRNYTALETLDELRRVFVLGQRPDVPDRAGGWVSLSGAVPVGSGDGPGFQVRVVDPVARTVLFSFDPFPQFAGAVRVATGDMNGDGVPDLAATPAAGGPPHVKVFDGRTGTLLASFYAFDPGFRAGLSVAVADVNGDGKAEAIVVPESGERAHVKAFTASGQLVRSFYAFDPRFLGGARVSAADVDGDGAADFVVSAGAGGRGHTVVFSGATGQQFASFLPFGAAFGGLASVAAGDFDGDGLGEVAVAPASGADPHVLVFRPLSQAVVSSFYAYAPAYRGGVRLGTFARGGRTELLTVSNTAVTASVHRYDAGALVDQFGLGEVGLNSRASFGG